MKQSDFKNVHFKLSFGYLSLHMHSALDHSAKFLTVLIRGTVKNLPSPIGPGFKSRRRRQKGQQSIVNVSTSMIQE